MGKYYKTHTVPLVDYTVDYPFSELLQSKMYKQKRADQTMDILDKKRQDMIDWDVIGGKQVEQTDENGNKTLVYQPSKDEMYKNTKLEEFNNLVEGMRGKDLANNYGAIRQEINSIYDPLMAKTMASKKAYDEEQKQIAGWRSKNLWDPANYQDPRGYDTESKGVYTATNKPYYPWREEAEGYFDDMIKDQNIQGGIEVGGISEDKIRRHANRSATAFAGDPRMGQAIDNWIMNQPKEDIDKMVSAGIDPRKRAAEDILYKTGMEKFHRTEDAVALTTEQKKAAAAAATKDDTHSYYLNLIQGAINNPTGGGKFSLEGGQGESIMGSTKVGNSNYFIVNQKAGQEGILTGRNPERTETFYSWNKAGKNETETLNPIKVGDYAPSLGRTVTRDDIKNQILERSLDKKFQNEGAYIEGWEKVQKEIDALESGKERFLSTKKFQKEDWVESKKEGFALTEIDRANQAALNKMMLKRLSDQDGQYMPHDYIHQGIIKDQVEITIPEDVYDHVPVYDITGKKTGVRKTLKYQKGKKETLTLNEGRKLLRDRLGRWDYDKDIQDFYGNKIDKLKADNMKNYDLYTKTLERYKDAGIGNPRGAYAQALRKQEAAGMENLTPEQKGFVEAISSKKIFGESDFKFRPTGQILIVDGQAVTPGEALITNDDLDAMMGDKYIYDDQGNKVAENPGWIGLWPGNPRVEEIDEMLVDNGFAEKGSWYDDKGERTEGWIIPMHLPRSIGVSEMQNYDKASGVSDNNQRDYGAANKIAFDATLIKAAREAAVNTSDARDANYKAILNNKYDQAINSLENIKPGSSEYQKLRGTDAYKSAEIDASAGVLKRLVGDYTDLIFKGRNSVDVDGNPTPWPEIDKFEKIITEKSDIIDNYINGEEDDIAKVIKAKDYLVDWYATLVEPSSYERMSEFNAQVGQRNTDPGFFDRLTLKNYKKFLYQNVDDALQQTGDNAIISGGKIVPGKENEYKALAKQEALSLDLSRISSDIGGLAIDNTQVYAPYVTKKFENVLRIIGGMDLEGLTVSGLFRATVYNNSLKNASKMSYHKYGNAADFSMNTDKKRKAAQALYSLIKSDRLDTAAYEVQAEIHGDINATDASAVHLHIEMVPKNNR